MRNVASPIARPSIVRGWTHCSTCSRSRRPPSSSSTASAAGAPSGTCTQTSRSTPAVAVVHAGSVRRHGASHASCSAATGSAGSAPRATSTAVSVSDETVCVSPFQSVKDVDTEYACARSIRDCSGSVTQRFLPALPGSGPRPPARSPHLSGALSRGPEQ